MGTERAELQLRWRPMPAAVVLHARGAPCPGPVAVPGGASAVVSVPGGLLSCHAIYTGGPLPAASSAPSRLMYRAANEAMLWAGLEVKAGQWRATQLYHHIETSEKAQVSYRFGTTFAGVASDLALGDPLSRPQRNAVRQELGPTRRPSRLQAGNGRLARS